MSTIEPSVPLETPHPRTITLGVGLVVGAVASGAGANLLVFQPAGATTGLPPLAVGLSVLAMLLTAALLGIVLRRSVGARPGAAVALVVGAAHVAAWLGAGGVFSGGYGGLLWVLILSEGWHAAVTGAGYGLVALVAARGPGRPAQHLFARPAFAVAGGLVAAALLVGWSNAAGVRSGLHVGIPFDVAVPAVAVAVVAGPSRRGLATLAGLVVLLHLDGLVPTVFDDGGLHRLLSIGATALWLAVPVLLAWGVRWLALVEVQGTAPGAARSRDLRLLAAVNVLNLADAALTWLVIARGTGEELNPVVDAIGLPGKVLLVALGTVLLHRLKPASLRWVALPLAVVVAHHLMGAVFVGV